MPDSIASQRLAELDACEKEIREQIAELTAKLAEVRAEREAVEDKKVVPKIKLDKETDEAIRAQAKAAGMTVSAYVRSLVGREMASGFLENLEAKK